MANEIRIGMSLAVDNGTMDQEIRPSTLQVTQNAQTSGGGIAVLTTTAAAIPTGSASTCGYAYFRNVSAVNNAFLGTLTGASFVQFAKLGPGEYALIRLGTNAPTAKCDASTVNLHYWILGD